MQSPVPVAARSKAWVCARSPAENLGSNSTGDIDVCQLWVFCVVKWRSLRRADHSSRGVLPTVVRRCVWSRNLVNEEILNQWGLSREKQTKMQSQRNCRYHLGIRLVQHSKTVINIIVCILSADINLNSGPLECETIAIHWTSKFSSDIMCHNSA